MMLMLPLLLLLLLLLLMAVPVASAAFDTNSGASKLRSCILEYDGQENVHSTRTSACGTRCIELRVNLDLPDNRNKIT